MKQYLFTVRRNSFEREVHTDSLLECPFDTALYDPDILRAQEELLGNPLKEELKEVGRYIHTTRLRLRFNNDIYPHVCLLRVEDDEFELDFETLDAILQSKEDRGVLDDFLKEATII